MADEQAGKVVELATELTIAWLGNPHTRASADEVNAFLSTLHRTVGALAGSGAAPADEVPSAEHPPAVTARKSLADPAFIVSMIDGKPYRTLKRHLATNGLTPAEYRRRYGLKADYPMVAPAYSEMRRDTARRLGLGRKKAEPAPAPVPAEPPAAKPRRRKSAADAKAAAKAHLQG